MNPTVRDVEILLGVDGTYRRVPMASLAAITRTPTSTLRESLSRLLFALSDRNALIVPLPEGEIPEGDVGTERFGSDGSVPIGPTVPEEKQNGSETFGSVPIPSDRSDACARTGDTDPIPGLTAEALATALDDTASLSFYRTLVATVDHAVLTSARDETLARRSLIRSRPGAYFTALVRRMTQPLYARTSTTPP